mgnify:CR=1 FL=1
MVWEVTLDGMNGVKGIRADQNNIAWLTMKNNS